MTKSKSGQQHVESPEKTKGKESVDEKCKCSSFVHKIWLKVKEKDFPSKPEFLTIKRTIIPMYDLKSDEMHINALRACRLKI
ncbi:hypothetical protein GCM10011361_03790 [Muriicola marianensis]|uniref:Uncharacterized protein n=1 Tax=Muriicola marianensis TaxID=1324801 RepID=A0ABQ1QSA5_9FLAO|nr:hypothetical protein GCM10011361_03790 [Muriicola marianensis]